jgi:hypothetical protein
MNSMFDAYAEWRRQGWSQQAAAQRVAEQYGRRDPVEVSEIRRQLVAIEERDGPTMSQSAKEPVT